MSFCVLWFLLLFLQAVILFCLFKNSISSNLYQVSYLFRLFFILSFFHPSLFLFSLKSLMLMTLQEEIYSQKKKKKKKKIRQKERRKKMHYHPKNNLHSTFPYIRPLRLSGTITCDSITEHPPPPSDTSSVLFYFEKGGGQGSNSRPPLHPLYFQ